MYNNTLSLILKFFDFIFLLNYYNICICASTPPTQKGETKIAFFVENG